MTAFAQSKLDRTIRPQSSGTPRVDLPDIQKATLRNGLKVWLVEDHELPLIAFNLVLQNGSASDPLNQAGLASMTADVLDEGTTTRSALQIADALDFIGANLTVNAFTDGSSITLSCMTKHVEKAVDVFCDVLVHPTFPAKDFDRLKQQRLTGLLQQRDYALYDMMENEKAAKLIERGVIEIAPLAFMRGRTLNDSFIILDEAQNTTMEQMKMFLTRLGFNSKAVITGDITQIDLPPGKASGLIEITKILEGIEGIDFVFFSERDVVRQRLVQAIVKAYDKYENRV